jgi:type II restriction/modification system DNA methylase subunit YeeA
VTRDFHKKSNFYTHKEHYQFLGRPTGVRLYDGEYQSAVESIEDIIAMHLASATADIVLLLGFDFGESVPPVDQFDLHKWTNRRGLIGSIILNTPEIQWLAVDHNNSLSKPYTKLPNLTCDKLKNVLQLLAHEK